MTLRRLLPSPADSPARAGHDEHDTLTVDEAAAGYRPRPSHRPWVALCMVSSLDGSTVADQRSAGLSSPTDAALMSALRRAADVIVVGAGTVRDEQYGPPRKSGQRIGVVTRTGRLPFDSPLFTSGAGFAIMPVDGPAVPIDTVRAGHGEVDLAAALAQLDASVVQAEGGPSLNGQLAAADLIDELNLTISPMIAGGDGDRLVAAAPPLTHDFHLTQLLEADGFLFGRWLRHRHPTPAG